MEIGNEVGKKQGTEGNGPTGRELDRWQEEGPRGVRILCTNSNFELTHLGRPIWIQANPGKVEYTGPFNFVPTWIGRSKFILH